MPTALIVEDEPEANELLALLVQLRGYDTESAFTGEEALQKVEQNRPDILFLDLMLPDITGYDVCASIKRRRATNAIPVVMVTARLAEENRRKGFRVGATEYLPKPYTPDQIFQAMSDADVWSKRSAELSDQGSFLIQTQDEIRPFKKISDLRRLLLTRSSLPEENVAHLGQCLNDILLRGLDWGRRHKTNELAKLNYDLQPTQFLVELKDQSGWFADDHPDEDGLAEAIAQAQFDRVEFDNLSGSLRLISHLPS